MTTKEILVGVETTDKTGFDSEIPGNIGFLYEAPGYAVFCMLKPVIPGSFYPLEIFMRHEMR